MIFIKAKDMASPIINKIKTSIKSLRNVALVVGGATIAGLGMGINGAMNLEQQKVSMEHFIGTQNKDMSKEQVGQTSNEYIK